MSNVQSLIAPNAAGISIIEQIKHWEAYGQDSSASDGTHFLEITDKMKSSGKVLIDFAPADNYPELCFSATAEINSNPMNDTEAVPCLHVHFDGDNLAFSLFKVGNKILLRPEQDVTLSPQQMELDGRVATMFVIEAEQQPSQEMARIKEVLKPWEEDFAEAARKEGWCLSSCSSGQSLEIQCQKIDNPEEDTHPYLDSDDEAMKIVLLGQEPHHIKAREILQQHSAAEWQRILDLPNKELNFEVQTAVGDDGWENTWTLDTASDRQTRSEPHRFATAEEAQAELKTHIAHMEAADLDVDHDDFRIFDLKNNIVVPINA